jgi:hypothetical protein
MCACLCVLIVEFSYSAVFVENEFQARILLYIIGKFLDKGIRHQLQDFILCMPISNAIGFFSYLIIFNSPNFIQFLVASFFLFGLSIFNRVYVDSGINFVVSTYRKTKEMSTNFIIRKTPKYLKVYSLFPYLCIIIIPSFIGILFVIFLSC